MRYSIEEDIYRPIGWALLFSVLCVLFFIEPATFWESLFATIALTYLFSRAKVRYYVTRSSGQRTGPYNDLEEALKVHGQLENND